MRLVINGYDIELRPDVTIAKTLQVNEIGSVNTRQTNYTNTFSIPRTANNIKAFDMLGIVGNDSNIPYRKNDCDLYSDSGESIVKRGWAIITSTDKDFKCNVYDGIIDFYKTIENLSLADLNLSELAHDKSVQSVTDSQDLSKPYVYIFADYNGKAIHSNKINIDYLVPSVKVSWLLEKIQSTLGITINGSFKTNPDFTNLYITYPKASPPVVGASVLTSNDISNYVTNVTNDYAGRYVPVKFNSFQTLITSKITLSGDQVTLIAVQNIKIKVTFTLNPYIQINRSNGSSYFAYARFLGESFICDGTTRTVSQYISLTAGQSFKFELEVVFNNYDDNPTNVNDFFLTTDFKELTNAVLFEEEFGGMQIKQFLSEILWMYNLTIFKDKTDNSYTFKYLSEILYATPIDWSNRFQSLDNENYIYGQYSQKNWLRHKYNDENSFFNDGFIEIDNPVLPDSKNIVSSVIYSPDFNQSSNIGFTSNVYRLWNKEIKDNKDVDYKTLSNRFYFLRAQQVTGTYDITSEVLSQNATLNTVQFDSYTDLKYSSIVDKYYSDFASILNKAKIITTTLRLNESDVSNIDFSKPVYLKQLGGSFFINKINNFIPYRDTKVELIKIQPKFIKAVDDNFTVTTIFPQQLNVMANDEFGAPDATIYSVDVSAFTLGTINDFINKKSVTFTPSVLNGTSTFIYKIVNSLGVIAQANATVTTNIPPYIISNTTINTDPTTTTFTLESSTRITVNAASETFQIGVKRGTIGSGTITGQIIIGGQTINISNTGTSYYYSVPFTLTQGVYDSTTFKVTAVWSSGFPVTGYLNLRKA